MHDAGTDGCIAYQPQPYAIVSAAAGMALPPLLLLQQTAALAAAAAAGAPSSSFHHRQQQCPGRIFPNCGMTDGEDIYNATAAPHYSACCVICASDARNCTAWVFVADSPVYSKGPGTCKLRHTTATCRPDKPNHVSGNLQLVNYTCDGGTCVLDPGGSYTSSTCADQCDSPPHPPPAPAPPEPPKPPAAGHKPHILLLVIDDWGWGNVGYHRQKVSGSSRNSARDDVATPNFDELVRSGIELNRNYVHKFCSPTRSSIQSGRLPVHVNLVNADPSVSNPKDPISGWAGIPRNMTGIAQIMRNAQYRTHLVGKWCGIYAHVVRLACILADPRE